MVREVFATCVNNAIWLPSYKVSGDFLGDLDLAVKPMEYQHL
jgi:hypothetical protein